MATKADDPDRDVPAKENPAKSKTKSKGGRPKMIIGEPWKELGISERTWFRRKKAGKL
jgi:hypothetical protein